MHQLGVQGQSGKGGGGEAVPVTIQCVGLAETLMVISMVTTTLQTTPLKMMVLDKQTTTELSSTSSGVCLDSYWTSSNARPGTEWAGRSLLTEEDSPYDTHNGQGQSQGQGRRTRTRCPPPHAFASHAHARSRKIPPREHYIRGALARPTHPSAAPSTHRGSGLLNTSW